MKGGAYVATKATTTNKTKKNTVSTGSSKKQPTTAEMREWYTKHKSTIERFERSANALQLLDPSKTSTKTFSTFSKETLRTYMKNPLRNYKNLRNLSRFLYYRSQVYRRIINYNANMIDLNMRSIIPLVDLVKGSDTTKVLKSYYETLTIVEKMNLPLEFLKAYVICWREDNFYGCAYLDDDGFFILPLDPDYCKVTGIYPTGDLAFDMDMTYFSQKEDQLEMWGEPFISMYNEYQKNSTSGRWQPMPDENCVCLKVNIDDWETPLPPYMALFNSLINLEDLSEITAIADEQQIYKLLVATIPTIKGSNDVDDFAIDPDTAISYFNKMLETLPEYTNAILSPIPVDSISFDQDQASDVNKLENATKSVLNTSGGAQVLNSGSISGTTAWTGAIKSDEDYALSSLLPQTQAIINRLLSYQLKDAAKVKLLEVTKYTKETFKSDIKNDATYGVPVKLVLNSMNGFSELETLSLNFLENDILKLHEKFVPLQSSNTMNTGDLQKTEGGAPTKSDTEITDDGEASKDKKDKKK